MSHIIEEMAVIKCKMALLQEAQEKSLAVHVAMCNDPDRAQPTAGTPTAGAQSATNPEVRTGQGWPVAFTSGICHRYLPVNTGMDNTPKSGVYRHLLAFINISLISLQIILLTVLATHYIIHGHHRTIFAAYA